MNCLGLLLVLIMQAPKPAPPPGMPVTPGVYFRQGDAQWIKLEPASMADMKSKGMEQFMDTYGYFNLDLTVTYTGAQAAAQIPVPRPVFYVRGVGSSKEAMIVQLTRKKDSRTIRTSSSAATTENKGGFKKQEIQNVTVTVYSDESFSVAPEDDLKPGEYLLVFGYANAGFDFGISRTKGKGHWN